MTPKELQSRIEELAEVRAEDEFKIGNVHNMSDYIKGYKAGAKAMHAELEPVLRDMVIVLEFASIETASRREVAFNSKQALAKYRGKADRSGDE